MFSKELLLTSDYNKLTTGAWTSSGQIGDYGAVSVVYGYDVTYGDSFYCCDSNGTQYRSTDGTTWTVTHGYTAGTMEHGRVFCVNGRFITFASTQTLDTVKYTVTYLIDGHYSLDLPSSANMHVDGACYFNGKYYIAGTQDGHGVIRYSADLVDWAESIEYDITLDTTAINSMACNDTCIVISANVGIYTSVDGLNFEKTMSGSSLYPQIIYAKDRFIAVEITGLDVFYLWQSFDGYEWTRTLTSFNRFSGFNCIAYGLNKFVIGTTINNTVFGSPNPYNAKFYTSLDPNDPVHAGWHTQTSNTLNGVNAIAYGNGRFVAVNENSPYTYSCSYKLWGIE
jgi:hypothetical protein